jgi:hypothetical protein
MSDFGSLNPITFSALPFDSIVSRSSVESAGRSTLCGASVVA